MAGRFAVLNIVSVSKWDILNFYKIICKTKFHLTRVVQAELITETFYKTKTTGGDFNATIVSSAVMTVYMKYFGI